MSTSSGFVIGEHSVRPGERLSLDLPLPRLYTHTALAMPVHVVNGKRAGPKLFVSAALHGDEINGVEIIRRLLKLPILNRLRGTLVAVPVVNVFGFVTQSRNLPDRRDLNRAFPGSERGSMAARLAKLFMEQITAHCTHGIDLHTGAVHRDNLPQIRACIEGHPETQELALAFGTPVIVNANIRDGSLRQAVLEKGIPMLVYEGGEALRFNEVAIRAGVRGVVSVMRALGMLPAHRSVQRRSHAPFLARSTHWVRAPQSGILRAMVALGAGVERGAHLGVVADPFGQREEWVAASASGIVIGRTNLPLVNEGEALFNIASFERPDSAAIAVEAFNEALNPGTDTAPGREFPIV